MSIYDYVEFRHIRYFIAAADEGNFTRAANSLNVAQSALSTQIISLEELFNTQLFDRVRGGVVLTRAGEVFYGFGKQLLELREEVIDSMQAVQQTTSQPFRLGFTQFVEHAVLQTVSQAYRELFPKGAQIFTNAAASLATNLAHTVEKTSALTMEATLEHEI
ncbi:MAG TPA: LysR family transcriptional regulator [Acidobacteriaceae bacterium]